MAKSSAEKKQIKDWIEDQVEYKNPNLPWNQPTKVRFPSPDAKDKEFIRTHDMYGNPYTPEQLEEHEKDRKAKEEEDERLRQKFTQLEENPIPYGKRDLYGNPIKEETVDPMEEINERAFLWTNLLTKEQQETAQKRFKQNFYRDGFIIDNPEAK